jgi:hypothetical protein
VGIFTVGTLGATGIFGTEGALTAGIFGAEGTFTTGIFGATGAFTATTFGGFLSCGMVAAGRAVVVAKAIMRIVPVM